MYQLVVKPHHRYSNTDNENIVLNRNVLDNLMYDLIKCAINDNVDSKLGSDYWSELYWTSPDSFTLDCNEQPPVRRSITREMVISAACSAYDTLDVSLEEVPDDKYADNAKRFFIEAGGNPEGYGFLADWTRNLKETGEIKSCPQAVVTAEGEIVATAHRVRDIGLTAYYIDSTHQTRKWGVANREIGLAKKRIADIVNYPVTSVGAWSIHR